MAASSPQQRAPECCLLGDMLHILPTAARQTLYVALKNNHSLPAARLSCRILREFIDGHAPELYLRVNRLGPADLLSLCHEGRWLQRWPRCTAVTLHFYAHAVSLPALPFATAPPEACQRITSLTLGANDAYAVLPSGVLLALTSRLPGLTSLRLTTEAPDPDDEDFDDVWQPVTKYALSLLPSLRSLTTESWEYVSCIPDGLAAQLTRLEVAAESRSIERPELPELVGLVGRLTSLQELVLKDNENAPFAYEDALSILDAVPGSLQSMELSGIALRGLGICLGFSGGSLDTARVVWIRNYDYASVSELLTRVLLPSRKLGPWLRVLHLGTIEVLSARDPDPAAALYARCDRVVVEGLAVREGAEEAALSVMRLTGLPAKLEWHADWPSHGPVLLRRPRAASGRPTVLPPSVVGQRAVERMAAADGPQSYSLLLRGPLVEGLLAETPAALRLWLEKLSGAVQRAPKAKPPRFLFRALRAAGALELGTGALILTCDSPEVAAAVAVTARRLAQAAASADDGGAGAGTAVLDIRCGCLHWLDATGQVLQALWDGEEGGVEEAGGAGAEAGAAGGAPAGACTAAELERVRCLLETWKGLRELPRLEKQ